MAHFRRRGVIEARALIGDREEMVDRATTTALSEEFAKPSESIVVAAGVPFGEAGTTNNLRVVQIGRVS